MTTTTPEPRAYQPLPRWMTCAECGAMWNGVEGSACWACIDGAGHPTRSPAITSQHGFAPDNFDDPRP